MTRNKALSILKQFYIGPDDCLNDVMTTREDNDYQIDYGYRFACVIQKDNGNNFGFCMDNTNGHGNMFVDCND